MQHVRDDGASLTLLWDRMRNVVEQQREPSRVSSPRKSGQILGGSLIGLILFGLFLAVEPIFDCVARFSGLVSAVSQFRRLRSRCGG